MGSHTEFPDLSDDDLKLAPYLGEGESTDDPETYDTALLATYEDPLVGTVLAGRYRVERLIGLGAHGRVYEAFQDPMQRQVAVKVLHVEVAGVSQDEIRARFLREAALGGALQHPNIIVVHDFGYIEGGSCFIVLELLEGRTLKRLISTLAPMEPAYVVGLARQIGRALRHAHRHGVVHRDIKPTNILVVPDGGEGERVKVLDFGLLKFHAGSLTDAPDHEITATGRFLGTPEFAAPEQIRGEAVDGRVDIYALGVILYEMLTGKHPFDSPTPVAFALRHLESPVPPMAERVPELDVPAQLEDIVRRCLEKEPAARWQSADELLDALDRYSASGEGTLPTEPRITLEETQDSATAASMDLLDDDDLEFPPPRRSLIPAFALVGAGGLVSVLALAYILFPPDERAEVPVVEVASGPLDPRLVGLWSGQLAGSPMVLQLDAKDGRMRATLTLQRNQDMTTQFYDVRTAQDGDMTRIALVSKGGGVALEGAYLDGRLAGTAAAWDGAEWSAELK